MSTPDATAEAVARITAALGDMPDATVLLYSGFGAGEWRHTFTVADLRALLSRLAECEADAARLDWLEGERLDPFTVTDLVCEWRWNGKRYPTGLRDVLDAAREGVRHG